MTARIWALGLATAVVLALSSGGWAQDRGRAPRAKRDGGASAKAKANPARPESGETTDEKPTAPDARAGSTDTAKDKASESTTDTAKTGAAKTDASKEKTEKEKPAKHELEKATFGGGCFWCMEAVFERVKGVKSVVSGYSGGNVPYPSYEMVHSGLTGHAEVVQIIYDPDVVTYERLVRLFFAAHDPTTPNMQGDDFGPQYRSVILYHNPEQQKTAAKVMLDLKAKRAFRNPIVTELVPFMVFFPAEGYHQDFYRNNRYTIYSQTHIMPKLKKLDRKLREK